MKGIITRNFTFFNTHIYRNFDPKTNQGKPFAFVTMKDDKLAGMSLIYGYTHLG